MAWSQRKPVRRNWKDQTFSRRIPMVSFINQANPKLAMLCCHWCYPNSVFQLNCRDLGGTSFPPFFFKFFLIVFLKHKRNQAFNCCVTWDCTKKSLLRIYKENRASWWKKIHFLLRCFSLNYFLITFDMRKSHKFVLIDDCLYIHYKIINLY